MTRYDLCSHSKCIFKIPAIVFMFYYPQARITRLESTFKPCRWCAVVLSFALTILSFQRRLGFAHSEYVMSLDCAPGIHMPEVELRELCNWCHRSQSHFFDLVLHPGQFLAFQFDLFFFSFFVLHQTHCIHGLGHRFQWRLLLNALVVRTFRLSHCRVNASSWLGLGHFSTYERFASACGGWRY